jgi:hypothetical protein
LKIEKKSSAIDFLREGDKITVAITHEIKIGHESSWVRYEAASAIADGETSETASERVINHVSKNVMNAVSETVEKVRAAQ